MLVRELIEKLQELPPDDEAWLTLDDVIAPVMVVHYRVGMVIVA